MSLLISVQPEGAFLLTTIWKFVAPPRAKEFLPFTKAPRSFVVVPLSKMTCTLSALSLRMTEIVPALFVTADAYGTACALFVVKNVMANAAKKKTGRVREMSFIGTILVFSPHFGRGW